MKRALLLVLVLGGCECTPPRSCKLWWTDGACPLDDAGELACPLPPPLEEWPAECVTYIDGGAP